MRHTPSAGATPSALLTMVIPVLGVVVVFSTIVVGIGAVVLSGWQEDRGARRWLA